jgi:hypothetical protein
MKARKFFRNWVLLSAVFATCALKVEGQQVTMDDIKYGLSGDLTASVTGNNSSTGDVTIRETFVYDGKTYTVTDIGDGAFEGNKSLTGINLPSSLKRIGAYAFKECSNLISVEIPDQVEELGREAFHQCTNLTYIKWPENLKTIGLGAFRMCGSIVSVELPQGVTYIDEWAFCDCVSLRSIKLPENLTVIGTCTFRNCSSLRPDSIKIPDGVTSIGDQAFGDCLQLTSVTLPDNLTRLGAAAFQGCPLSSITFPKGLKRIETAAFHSTKISAAVLPDGMEFIGRGAFAEALELRYLELPQSLTQVEDAIVSHCPKLEILIVKWTDSDNVSVHKDFLGGVNEKCRVFIPEGTYELYSSWFSLHGATIIEAHIGINQGEDDGPYLIKDGNSDYEEPAIFQLETACNPLHGVIYGKGRFAEGTEVEVTAQGTFGYEFVNWTSGDRVVSTDNPLRLSLTQDMVLIANFRLKNGNSDGTTSNETKVDGEPAAYYTSEGLRMEGLDGYTVAIVSMSGKVIRKFKPVDGLQPISLPQGVYLLNAVQNDKSFSRKFTVR